MRRLARVLELGFTLRIWVALSVTGLAAFSDLVCRSWFEALLQPTVMGDWSFQKVSLGVVFFSTLALYNLDGTFDAPREREGPGSRRRTHLALTVCSTLLLLPLLALLPGRALLLCILGLFIASFYALPWGPTSPSLFKTAGVKAPFVGSSVAVACVWVPWLSEPHGSDVLAAFPRESLVFGLTLTGTLALLCTANAVLFDVPDLHNDARLGVRTLPVRKGIRHAARHALLLVALAAGVWLSGNGIKGQPLVPLEAHFGLVSLVASLALACFWVNENSSRNTVAFWVDGALLLPLFVGSFF